MRGLFANISLVVLLNVLIKPVWLIVENIVHNAVGHADWGIYTALLSFAFLFTTFADLGINQYATKTLAGEPEQLRTLYPQLLTLKTLITFLYPAVAVGIGWLWGFRGFELYLLILLSLIQGAHQLSQFFRANFQAMQRFRLDGFASITDKALLLIITLILLSTTITIERFAWARVASSALAGLFFFIALMRIYGWVRPRLNIRKVRQIIQASFSFAIITILYSVHDKVDQVMLERISGEVETSLYAGAYRWLDAFSTYLWLTLAIFFAKFAYHIHQTFEKTELLRMGQTIVALPLIYVSVFSFFYGEKLLILFTNSNAAQIATMTYTLKVLFLTLLSNGLLMIYSTLLTATGHERFVSRTILFGVLLNILLNLVFMPRFGAAAAAWSTVASFSLLGICYLWFAHFRLAVKVPFDLLKKLCLILVLLLACFWALEQAALPWYLVSGAAFLFFIGLSWGLKLIPKDLWRSRF